MLSRAVQNVQLTGAAVAAGRAFASAGSSTCGYATKTPGSDKIYEYRTYTCNPKDFPDFLRLTNEKIHMRTAHSKLLGYWTTEIGGQNEVVHLWEYDSLQHRQAVRSALVADESWMKSYMALMRPMLQRQENHIMRDLFPEHKFAPAPAATDAPSVFELHANYLKPRGMPKLQAMTRGMKPFPMLKQVVGCWGTLIGEKNLVLTLLRWDSFEQRSELKEMLDRNELYQHYLNDIAALSDRRTSKIAFATPFSPLQ